MSQIPTTYVTTYRSNMRLALNQQNSKFRGTCLEQGGSGELQQLDNIVGNGMVKKRSARGADIVHDDPSMDRVWCPAPGEDYDADFVATIDKLRTGIDLQGGFVKKHAGTIRRAWDGAFLGGYDGTCGFYGNMYMGKTGGTLVPFAGTNIIPVTTGAAGPTGMNVAKVLAAREQLAAQYAELDDQWYLGVTAHEITGLFNQVQVTSADFLQAWKPRFSADGKSLLGLAGFEFVEIELNNPLLPNYGLTKDGNGYQKNPYWLKSGMSFVFWEELYSSIDPLAQKGNDIQLYTRTYTNAVRTDNARCGIILNA